MVDPMSIVAHFEKNPMHAIMILFILYRYVEGHRMVVLKLVVAPPLPPLSLQTFVPAGLALDSPIRWISPLVLIARPALTLANNYKPVSRLHSAFLWRPCCLARIYSVLGGGASPETKHFDQKFLAENKLKEGVVTLPSGLQYKVLRAGDGDKHPLPNSPCDCHYEGRCAKDWPTGKKFDSSYDRGSPTAFAPNQVLTQISSLALPQQSGVQDAL